MTMRKIIFVVIAVTMFAVMMLAGRASADLKDCEFEQLKKACPPCKHDVCPCKQDGGFNIKDCTDTPKKVLKKAEKQKPKIVEIPKTATDTNTFGSYSIAVSPPDSSSNKENICNEINDMIKNLVNEIRKEKRGQDKILTEYENDVWKSQQAEHFNHADIDDAILDTFDMILKYIKSCSVEGAE